MAYAKHFSSVFCTLTQAFFNLMEAGRSIKDDAFNGVYRMMLRSREINFSRLQPKEEDYF
jgi:hypothetical protein